MKKFIRALIEYWYIWMSVIALMALLLYTAIQLHFFKSFKEYRGFFIWPRVFVIVFPFFIIFVPLALSAYELLPQGSLAHHLGENTEEAARSIGNAILYVSSVITTFFLARWRRKNLPQHRIEIIDKGLDKIFGKDSR